MLLLPSICFAVVALFALANAVEYAPPAPVVQPPPKCGPFEEYTLCGSTCPKTCENLLEPPRACSELCVKGCFCIDGYVRNGNRCVPPEDCRPRCGYNETFRLEYPNCRTCDNLIVRKSEPGCYCKDEYVLNRISGQCLFQSDCPRIDCNEKEFCPANEELDRCKNPCERTCEQPDQPLCNFFVCNDGCVCKYPLIRDVVSGNCIEEKFCPVSCSDPNAVQTKCAPKCPVTCQNRYPQSCPKDCSSGCVCRNGFIKDASSGKCVLPEYCPVPAYQEHPEHIY